MAVDKLVDSTQLDSDLTSVANAIRTKGGTSAQMAFPAGFVSAVQAIQTGITPTGTKQISITENGTTTEDVTNYASAEISVNVSGGGGGTGYTLLASGSYTYAGSATGEIHFPVTYTGTAVYAYAVADEIIAGTNQSYCFAAFPADGLPFTQYLGGGRLGITSIVNTSGVISSNVISETRISNGNLYLSRANNTYLIQPNTYNWYVYGEAAT